MLTDDDIKHAFPMRFLDGTPVPKDYAKAIAKLVSDAADGDPGELDEAALPRNQQCILTAIPETTP